MQDESKKNAARRAVAFVEEGQVIGLGTGSTAAYVLEDLGGRVQAGLAITGVATSARTEQRARELGITIVGLNDVERINITIDGADEVDPAFNMIKGGGGALTREKLVALASERRVIVIDESKQVPILGKTRAVPVEVLPFAWRQTERRLVALGCNAILRGGPEGIFTSDNGNYIVDCEFGEIADPRGLEKDIKQLPGVVECGLFIGIADCLVIGRDDGVAILSRP